MENEMMIEDQQCDTMLNPNVKSSSDKIIAEILLGENVENKTEFTNDQYSVLCTTSTVELDDNPGNEKHNCEDAVMSQLIDGSTEEVTHLNQEDCQESLQISEALQLKQDAQNSVENNTISDDATFEVIESENIKVIEPTQCSIELGNEDLDSSSQRVVLEPHGSDLADIDELSTYNDSNNVLIPKFVVEDSEDLTLAEVSSTVQVGSEVSSDGLNTLPGADCLVAQTTPSTEVISLPVANNVTSVNPAIVGVAELDGNIVSIGGQHFILFTGFSQAGTTLEPGVSTVVTNDGNQVLSQDTTDDEPPNKKTKTDDSQPSSLSETGIENLVGFHSPQPNVVEVVEEDKSQEGGEDMKDEPVDVTQAWFTTRDDKYKLQSTGSTWKQGQWSKDEVEILQDNINAYCKAHNISDPTEVIFEMSKDERKNFYRTIAMGLNRPLFSVYRRVIRMYDQKNHIGRYTPEEVEKLKELRKRLGTDWAAIGAELGRSASSVKDRCRVMKDQCYTGKWLPEEEKQLANAVFRLSGAMPGVDVTVGLSWAAVAEQVGTRNEKQCRTKWLNYLNWKQRGGTEWTRMDDITLIEIVSNLNVTDETHINWEQLAKDWTSVRSPQWLRGKWWSLKRTVPDYQIISFQELINGLKYNAKNFQRVGPYRSQQTSFSFNKKDSTLTSSVKPQNVITQSSVVNSQANYIVTSQPCYEISLPLSVSLSTDDDGKRIVEQSDTEAETIANTIQDNVVQKVEVCGEQQSVIYTRDGHCDSPVVLAYPGGEDSSSDSKGTVSLKLQQQNPMMSSAVKSDD